MSAQITWQNVREPGRETETIGVASDKTAYYVYDNGNGNYLATVRTKKGPVGTMNYEVKDDCKGLDDAKAACQADFDAGQRP